MKKIFSAILALIMILSLSACGGGKTIGGEKPENGIGTPVASTATDKWPSGVYEAYNIPEYKGKVIYTYPGDETGSVMIKTTREELVAYVDALKEDGFRIRDYEDEDIRNDSWGSFEIFFPESGSGYCLSGYFSFENDGAGITDVYYDDDNNEVEIQYNLSLSMSHHEDPGTEYQSDILTNIGLQDADIIPKDAKSAAMQVYTLEPYYAMGGFGFPFDYELNETIYRETLDRIIDACCAASDNGKLKNVFGEEELGPEEAKAAEWGSWLYTYKGKQYMFIFLAESGFGEGISLSVQEIQ